MVANLTPFYTVVLGIHQVRSALIYVVLSLCDSPKDECPLGPIVYAAEVFSPKAWKVSAAKKPLAVKRIFLTAALAACCRNFTPSKIYI